MIISDKQSAILCCLSAYTHTCILKYKCMNLKHFIRRVYIHNMDGKMFYGKLLQVKRSQHFTIADPRRGIHRDWLSYFRVLMGHYFSFCSYKVSTAQKRVTFTEHSTNGKQLEWLLCFHFIFPSLHKQASICGI